MTRRILIAVGSNIDPQLHVKNGVASLKNAFDKITVSTFYWTKPLQGRNEQPDYLNGAILLRTGQPLEAVRKILAKIEADEGRERIPGDAYASRTLDLDIVAVEDGAIPPSSELVERDFVLVPAAELWPDFVWPRTGQTLKELAAAIGTAGLKPAPPATG
jgi:2-amino-4-hydroxy-6-hydroxymethyldihydropteridine diphosphokinase